jgi:hypothetical protein
MLETLNVVECIHVTSEVAIAMIEGYQLLQTLHLTDCPDVGRPFVDTLLRVLSSPRCMLQILCNHCL